MTWYTNCHTRTQARDQGWNRPMTDMSNRLVHTEPTMTRHPGESGNRLEVQHMGMEAADNLNRGTVSHVKG